MENKKYDFLAKNKKGAVLVAIIFWPSKNISVSFIAANPCIMYPFHSNFKIEIL